MLHLSVCAWVTGSSPFSCHCCFAHVLLLPRTSCTSRASRLQGNMDPGVLFGSKETIEERVMDVIKKARSQGVR